MKKCSKIIFLLMIISILTANFSILLGGNEVKAVIVPIEKADLYSHGEVVLFRYDDIGIGVEVIVYEKDGVEYPVYCLDKGRQSVTQDFEYSVDINQLLTNQKIWRAIVNGYPFKTPAELGCETVEEAYAATKMAVYDAMFNYDLEKFTIHKDLDSNRRTVAAIKNIITAARNSTETKIAAVLKIQETTEKWQVDSLDKNYMSKTYNVAATAANEKYQISIDGENTSRFKITDINNVEKTEFNKAESFKVLVPISDLIESGEFTITASSSLATKPIFYGETPNPDWQNFAVTAGTYEMATTTLKQKYEENKTTIEIKKRDGDTKTALAGGVFNLLDENKQLLHAELTSNDEGIITIDYLLPGKYYLEEVMAPNGYYGYDELIEIEIGLQEKVVITVDNFEEEEEVEKVVPEAPQENQYYSSLKLPRTGF